MAYTLLEMTQRVAEFINGGTVSSISDTRESEQIATIIIETYQDLIVTKQIRAKKRLFKLHSLSDITKPTYFKMLEPVIRLDYLKYICEDEWKTLDFVEPEEFVERSLFLKDKENVQEVVDFSDVDLYIETDKDPSYYTSLDDNYIICNSFNRNTETTLQEDKISCKGIIMPEFKKEDSFIPEIAEQHFPLLLSQAKLNADMELKGSINQLESSRAQKQAAITDTIAKTNRSEGNYLWMNRLKTGR